jgi:hypothetical protein
MTTAHKITIPDVPNPDDRCVSTIFATDAAAACLAEADRLPDGAPEQLGVLLRGILAGQLAQLECLVGLVERFDAWGAMPDDEQPADLQRSHPSPSP